MASPRCIQLVAAFTVTEHIVPFRHAHGKHTRPFRLCSKEPRDIGRLMARLAECGKASGTASPRRQRADSGDPLIKIARPFDRPPPKKLRSDPDPASLYGTETVPAGSARGKKPPIQHEMKIIEAPEAESDKTYELTADPEPGPADEFTALQLRLSPRTR